MESQSPALFLIYFLSVFSPSYGQQSFLNNDQLDCSNNVTSTYGYVCNGVQRSCNTFLIFRSDPPYYDSAVGIAYLLNSDAEKIAEINGVSDVEKIPKDTQIIVPVNCSCAGDYYQHNSSYTMKSDDENYYVIANVTYQGLTTCAAMNNQNVNDTRHLDIGMTFLVPLRCACPSKNQTARGVKLLLTYLITWGDTVSEIAKRFNADEQSVWDANELKSDEIYPFNPLLIPLKSEPTRAQTVIPSYPPSESPSEPVPAERERRKPKPRWESALIGIGIGVGLLGGGLLVWFLHHRRHHGNFEDHPPTETEAPQPEKTVNPPFPKGIVREAIESLTVYAFSELQEATGFFREDRKIKGSVYRGVINGDDAAIKRMGGDVSKEINILKQINHSHLIRLSGFSLHGGDTYLVYELAENGSLSDWLHDKRAYHCHCLSWKERVQIAFDIADGLNYLHNYADPPYIHKDLKSSNVLLDSNFRAKVSNFSLARMVENGENGMQLTTHVVGTQGYIAPEYLEHGLVTPKIDVFAFGVVMLELLSGREAVIPVGKEGEGEEMLLSVSIKIVLEGEKVREKLKGIVDPCLRDVYPLSLAFSFAHLAMACVSPNPGSRPTMLEVYMSLLKILSSSLDWDPGSSQAPNSDSFLHECE